MSRLRPPWPCPLSTATPASVRGSIQATSVVSIVPATVRGLNDRLSVCSLNFVRVLTSPPATPRAWRYGSQRGHLPDLEGPGPGRDSCGSNVCEFGAENVTVFGHVTAPRSVTVTPSTHRYTIDHEPLKTSHTQSVQTLPCEGDSHKAAGLFLLSVHDGGPCD